MTVADIPQPGGLTNKTADQLAQYFTQGGGGVTQAGTSSLKPSLVGDNTIFWSTGSNTKDTHPGPRDPKRHDVGYVGGSSRTTHEAMGWLYNQSSTYRAKIIRDLVRAQFIPKGTTGVKAITAGWSAFLGTALASQLASQKDGQPILTALQLLHKWQANPKDSPAGGDGSGFDPAGKVLNTSSSSHSSSDTQYDITKPLAAKNLINSASTAELGQTATAGQVKQFTGQLNRSEQKNPGHSSSSGGGTSVTTAVGDGTTHTTSSESSSGQSHTGYSGADRAQQAIDFARSQKDWASYQGATTFMDAFINSIAAPVGIR